MSKKDITHAIQDVKIHMEIEKSAIKEEMNKKLDIVKKVQAAEEAAVKSKATAAAKAKASAEAKAKKEAEAKRKAEAAKKKKKEEKSALKIQMGSFILAVFALIY